MARTRKVDNLPKVKIMFGTVNKRDNPIPEQSQKAELENTLTYWYNLGYEIRVSQVVSDTGDAYVLMFILDRRGEVSVGSLEEIQDSED